MNKTGLVWHELYMWHDTGNYAGLMQPSLVVQPNIHYESPEPKRRIKNLLDVTGVQLGDAQCQKARLAHHLPPIVFHESSNDELHHDQAS